MKKIDESVSDVSCERQPNRWIKMEVWKGEGFAEHKMFESLDKGKTWSDPIWQNRSKRPYVLGQACDGTICTCVLSLFWHFCESEGLDPTKLLAEAYPDEECYQKNDWDALLRTADAEGVEIPDNWTQVETAGLRESLTEINYHSLVGVLLDKGLLPEELPYNRPPYAENKSEAADLGG